jgi:hypothetical protein
MWINGMQSRSIIRASCLNSASALPNRLALCTYISLQISLSDKSRARICENFRADRWLLQHWCGRVRTGAGVAQSWAFDTHSAGSGGKNTQVPRPQSTTYCILSTTLTSILCFTNHPLLVVHSCPSAGMKSNRVTSEGTSFVISRREMFLPMHDLEPAPNCLDKSQQSFYFSSSGVRWAQTASKLCSIELSRAGSTSSQRSGLNSCTSGPQIEAFEWITQALTPTTVWRGC